MIRHATIEDIPKLVECGSRFLQYSPYGRYDVEYSFESSQEFLEGILANDNGVIIVMDHDGVIAGGLVGLLNCAWFAPGVVTAHELAWWVDPEHRQGVEGIKLVKEFERWAKEKGAKFVTLTDLIIGEEYPVGKLIGRMGYKEIERAHIKEV